MRGWYPNAHYVVYKFAIPILNLSSYNVVTPKKLEKWKYLEPILQEISEKDDNQVDLLIGANCIQTLQPIKVNPSKAWSPYAYKTVLGWCVFGPMGVNKANLKEMKCNSTYVHKANSVKKAYQHFALKGPVRETNIAIILGMIYETDFTEPQLQPLKSSSWFKEFSFTDARNMELMDQEVKQIDGNYQLPPPLENLKLEPSNNQMMVERRINQLDWRFRRESYFQCCKTFMDDMLAKEYAKKSTSPFLLGKTWYTS